MPYLSNIWSLREAASWLALRHPDLVDDRFELIFATDALPRSLEASAAAALDELLREIMAGRVGVNARNVRSNSVGAISVHELLGLEFHIATDVPGAPHGFRSVIDGVLTWIEPTVSAREVLNVWPADPSMYAKRRSFTFRKNRRQRITS